MHAPTATMPTDRADKASEKCSARRKRLVHERRTSYLVRTTASLVPLTFIS